MSEKVVVIGAGQMGLGIAHAFATSGFGVTMVDLSDEILQRSKGKILALVDGAVARGKAEAGLKDKVDAGLALSTDLAASVQGAQLVIETATENVDTKIALLKAADDAMGDAGFIATNTSALSITELAAATSRPERMGGLHFFNPVHKMKLVEIIKGLATSDETVARYRAWCDAIGKTSIVVNEAPGFTTSRMSALMGNEAMWMLSEGVASAEDIDTALRMGFNHPMGPLELGDLTGWDTRYAVLQYLHSVLGEKFRPCPLIGKMVKAGRYGRKVGIGVYEYRDGQKVPNSGLRPF